MIYFTYVFDNKLRVLEYDKKRTAKIYIVIKTTQFLFVYIYTVLISEVFDI